jgi:hypothetical protein
MEKCKYISFEGNRVRIYWLRGEYCALDKDLAEFFGVLKKYLLFTFSINKERFSEFDVFAINDIEYDRIIKAGDMALTGSGRKVYAFNLRGIVTVASRLLKSETASKLSVWVTRVVVNSDKFNIFEILTKA